PPLLPRLSTRQDTTNGRTPGVTRRRADQPLLPAPGGAAPAHPQDRRDFVPDVLPGQPRGSLLAGLWPAPGKPGPHRRQCDYPGAGPPHSGGENLQYDQRWRLTTPSGQVAAAP